MQETEAVGHEHLDVACVWITVSRDRDREQVAWELWAWPRTWAACNDEYIAGLRAVLEATTVSCKRRRGRVIPLLEGEGAIAATDCAWFPRDFCLPMSYFEVRTLKACVLKSSLCHCDKMPENISFMVES